MNLFNQERQEHIGLALLCLITLLCLYTGVKTVSEWKTARSTPNSAYPGLTISVDGTGKSFVIPDTAQFNYTVREKAPTVGEAQTKATTKSKAIQAALVAGGIDAKNIKTISYNVYPQYEYRSTQNAGIGMPIGNQVLVGYEVAQTEQVKTKDTTKAGEFLGKVGSLGASDVSALEFGQENDDIAQDDARSKAIDDADRKAHKLADQMGVRIIRTTGFYENVPGVNNPMYEGGYQSVGMDSNKVTSAPSPELAVGENEVVANVTVTYEIR